MNQTRLILIGILGMGILMLCLGLYIALRPDGSVPVQISQPVQSPVINAQPSNTPIAQIDVNKQIEVPMNKPWTDSGIQIKAGQRLIINASGKGVWKNIDRSNPNAVPGPYEECNPEGTSPNSKDYFSNISLYQTREANKGALIGRIGVNGLPFKIGTNFSQTVNESGPLYLGINDMKQEIDSSSYNDNSGAFQARIEIK